MKQHDEDGRDEALPEHETRPERGSGAGLTSAGVSAEDEGTANEDVLEARTDDDEPALDPDEPPPAYRPPAG